MARRTHPLPVRADVVIVGGGVVGASAAFHLAEAGAQVVLLERDQLGSGSTSKAAGGFRTQFCDPLNIEIARRSPAAFKAFDRRPGWEIDLHEVGYLFLLTREEDVDAFTRSVALQNELGIPTRMVTPEEARELSPLLEVDDVLAASYSPQDGHATPEAVVQGYASAARALGAHLQTSCEVDRIEPATTGSRPSTPATGRVRTDTVICAAGAWSRRCGELVGRRAPRSPPLRRQVLFTEPMADLPPTLPLTIDFATTFYYHREGPGLLMGMSDPTETPGLQHRDDRRLDPRAARHRRSAARRGSPTPASAAAGPGLYDMSPDHNAIIGEAAGVSRFLYATGFSGHGFLQGPATGELLRDLVLRRPTFADIAPLERRALRRLPTLRPEHNIV